MAVGQGAKGRWHWHVTGLVAVLLAVAIQVQLTLFKNDDYLGLRVNAADFILPVAGFFILFTLALRKSSWPSWRLRFTYIWLALLTAVLGLALANGYYLTGELSRWALVNKFCGWFVLMAYFGLGGWLSANGGVKFQRYFVKGFLLFFLLVLVIGLLRGLYDIFGPGLENIGVFQLSGIMGNRNSYAFLFLAAMALLLTFQFEGPIFKSAFYNLFWLIIFLAATLNGSRAGWAVGGLLLLFFLFRHRTLFLKQIAPWLAIGAVAAIAAFNLAGVDLARENQLERMADIGYYDRLAEERERYHTSEAVRFRGFADAFEMWRTHPVKGIGLGSFLYFSQVKYANDLKIIIDVIHSSLLWLLTETGLAGALLFLAFYIAVLWVLWRDSQENKNFNGRFLWSVFLIMIIFGLLSLLHEMLYTRFLWLFLGMAMARVPANTEENKEF